MSNVTSVPPMISVYRFISAAVLAVESFTEVGGRAFGTSAAGSRLGEPPNHTANSNDNPSQTAA